VWPETAVPFYFLYDAKLSEKVIETVYEMETDFLIGSPSFKTGSEEIEYYNSAYLINAESKTIEKYDKVHLVPFGEYVPFKKWLPFLGKMVAQVGDFKSGEKGETLSWNNQKLGILICFEIIFPGLSRAMVQNGTDFLINITNDAWFGKTSAPYQHFSMAIFRAVENKRFLVRAANTGISGFIDPVGKVWEQSTLLEDAVLTQAIPIYGKITVYSRFGDFLAITCSLVSAVLICVGLVRKLNKK
jgi:apolipoprotein N-acyltransferase